jgi:hypothetical protein
MDESPRPRLAPVEPRKLSFLARLFVRFVYWACRRKLGHVVQPLQIAAHRPGLLLGVGIMEEGQARCRALPAALKGLAQVRVATRVGCPF